MNRVFGSLTIAAGIICCLAIVLLPISYSQELADYDSAARRLFSPDSVAVTSNARCGIYKGGVWLFSGDVPYMGSSMHVVDSDGRVGYEHGRRTRETRDWCWTLKDFGFLQATYTGENGEFVGRDRAADLPGIYYRHFEWWKQVRPWWTVRVSLCYPIVAFAVLPTVRIFRAVRRQTISTTGAAVRA